MKAYEHFPNIPAMRAVYDGIALTVGSYVTSLSLPNEEPVYVLTDKFIDFIIDADVYTGSQQRAMDEADRLEAEQKELESFIDSYLHELGLLIEQEEEEDIDSYLRVDLDTPEEEGV